MLKPDGVRDLTRASPRDCVTPLCCCATCLCDVGSMVYVCIVCTSCMYMHPLHINVCICGSRVTALLHDVDCQSNQPPGRTYDSENHNRSEEGWGRCKGGERRKKAECPPPAVTSQSDGPLRCTCFCLRQGRPNIFSGPESLFFAQVLFVHRWF
mgnify:CR=1 FL=1